MRAVDNTHSRMTRHRRFVARTRLDSTSKTKTRYKTTATQAGRQICGHQDTRTYQALTLRAIRHASSAVLFKETTLSRKQFLNDLPGWPARRSERPHCRASPAKLQVFLSAAIPGPEHPTLLCGQFFTRFWPPRSEYCTPEPIRAHWEDQPAAKNDNNRVPLAPPVRVTARALAPAALAVRTRLQHPLATPKNDTRTQRVAPRETCPLGKL